MNKKGLTISGQTILFKDSPYEPEKTVYFPEQRPNNLDFGNNVFASYPAQGLKKKQLLEKPEQIKVIVFYPNNAKEVKINTWCNAFGEFVKSFNIPINFNDFRSYNDNILDIQRQCRNLNEYDLALLFIPNKETFNYSS